MAGLVLDACFAIARLQAHERPLLCRARRG